MEGAQIVHNGKGRYYLPKGKVKFGVYGQSFPNIVGRTWLIGVVIYFRCLHPQWVRLGRTIHLQPRMTAMGATDLMRNSLVRQQSRSQKWHHNHRGQ